MEDERWYLGWLLLDTLKQIYPCKAELTLRRHRYKLGIKKTSPKYLRKHCLECGMLMSISGRADVCNQCRYELKTEAMGSNPSPEDIRLACIEIRKGWTQQERELRFGIKTGGNYAEQNP